jgi:hypothetical protein
MCGAVPGAQQQTKVAKSRSVDRQIGRLGKRELCHKQSADFAMRLALKGVGLSYSEPILDFRTCGELSRTIADFIFRLGNIYDGASVYDLRLLPEP